VRAAGKQRYQHHQIGQREQPLLRLRAGSLGGPRNHAQVAATREIVQMLHAYPRQTGDFGVCEDFLTRLYRNHF